MQAASTLPKLGNGNTILFGCIVGSHAYGTNVEGSDIDKKWVYVQNPTDLFINGYRPQIEISKDEVAIELSRFFELLKKANPTMLELLYTPSDCILYKHRCFDKVLSLRRAFLTKQCKWSFGGYAIDQIEKAQGLDKKMNWEKERTERKSVINFCYYLAEEYNPRSGVKFQSTPVSELFTHSQIKEFGLSAIPHTRGLYNVYFDKRYAHQFKGLVQDVEKSNDISLSEVPPDATHMGLIYFNKDAYQQHCKDYNEYQEWLKKRNTQRYVDIENHGQLIDGKNLLHCVRLIETAQDIVAQNDLVVRRPNAQYLREIRQGKHKLEDIIEHAQKGIDAMYLAFDYSALPEKFKEDATLKLFNYQIRKEMVDGIKDAMPIDFNY